jgi:hypothetical protein
MFLYSLVLLNPLYTGMSSAANQKLDTQDVEGVIKHYGKYSIAEFILKNNSGRITLQIGNRIRQSYGSPNPEYMNAYTIGMDLNQIGATVPELNKALSINKRTQNTTVIIPSVGSPNVEPSQNMLAEVNGRSDTLGLTYSQMMNYLSNVFLMKFSPLNTGRPRYMGYSDNGQALLEIVGDKRDIDSTSLILGLSNSSRDVLVKNAAILVRFMRNAVPEWPESEKWVNDTIKRMVAQSDDEESISYGRKQIRISRLNAVNSLAIFVTPIT